MKIIEEKSINKDITNMSLNNPNPISKRLDEYDPKLFKIDISKEYKAYSRICPSNVRRQPVILTDQEKEYIDKFHKGSYEEAIKYGSDPNKQHWFICPRYWSLKDNVSLTQEQVESGKYGKVIPRDAKKVPPGGNIYEFTDDKYHLDKSGKYVQHYPGFVKDDVKHPHGLCVPCCFKLWNTPTQQARRKQCLQEEKEEKIKLKKKNKQVEDYIKGPDKFPLDNGRWGIIPLSVQKLLQFNNKDCFDGNNIKSNKKCILRNGIEYSINQSFIGCIANLYSEYNNGVILSITEMKEKLINSISIDFFIKLNNGNLISIFLPKSINENINIEDYKDSNLYKRLDYQNKNNLNLFKKIINSYNNFLNFLKSDQIIDYKYLWDVVSYANDKLFPNGINLLIIDIESDDITNDIKILCPNILFSNNFYNESKKVFLILKKNNFYEPIYIYSNNQIKISITRLYNLNNKLILPKLKLVIEKILNDQNKLCLSKNLNKTYNFEKNSDINKLINILSQKYEILHLIQNFNNKIIGTVININNKKQFVPCYPSILVNDIDYDYKTSAELYDLDVLNNYNNTIELLKIIDNLSDIVHVKPIIKVIEDEQIIGILTNSNQFIPLAGPENNVTDDLKIINDKDYILADNKIQNSDKLDNERIKMVNFIKVETIFYNLFRNIIKINMSENKNYSFRKQIVDILNNKTNNYLYNEKLEKINEILKQIIDNKIQFEDYKSNNEIIKILETSIINNIQCNNIVCDEIFCKKIDNECITIFPKNNFITNEDNETNYYYKISDELIRYDLIKSYILQPNKFMYFNTLVYNIKDNEQLLLQSSINQEFFENLIEVDNNIFANYNVYENTSEFKAKPIKVFTNINYNSVTKNISLLDNEKTKDNKTPEDNEKPEDNKKPEEKDTEIIENKDNEICKLNLKKVVGKWKPIFKDKTQELFYFIIKNNEICTFEIMKLIFENFYNKNYTKVYIKNELINSYKKLIENNGVNEMNIINILKNEKKDKLIDLLSEGEINIETLIQNDNYFISNLDILTLIYVYKLPIVILSTLILSETKKNFILINKSNNDSYYYIKIIETDSLLNKYRLLINNGEILYNNSDILDTFINSLKDENEFNLINYINNFKLKVKKPKFKLIE